VIRKEYESLNGLEYVDKRLLLVKNIFELKTMIECTGSSVKEVRDFSLSFINDVMKPHIETYYTNPKSEQEKYMLVQLMTEF